MAKMYRLINRSGKEIEGTFAEACAAFGVTDLNGATVEQLRDTCEVTGVKLVEFETVDPVDPEDNPHNFTIAGYSNITAIHPVGSYIGWSRGPTVFAGPLVYLSEANDALDEALEEQDEQNAAKSVYTMFKDVVAEAKRPASERGANVNGMLHSCSIPHDAWFGKNGHYLHLTDEYISNLSLSECRLSMALFIATCYRQR